MSCPYLAQKDGDWYCTSKGGYVSCDSYCAYNYEACGYYNSGNGGGSLCFLTTACVYYKGLSDDCYELNTLRNFRDNYLMTFEDGRKDVDEYYGVAPKILWKIFLSASEERIFEEIYDMISVCITHINEKRYNDAHKCYKNFVCKLKNEFNVE